MNLNNPRKARAFIKDWIAKFKEVTGKEIKHIETSSGEQINIKNCSDEQACFIAQEFKSWTDEANRRILEKTPAVGGMQ